MDAPLSSLIHCNSLQPHNTVTWTPEAEKACTDMKVALQIAPTLGLPDPTQPFVQTVDEKNCCMIYLLLQQHGGKLRPVAYFSSKLDPVAAGLPHSPRKGKILTLVLLMLVLLSVLNMLF
uniref:Reverse transcriptase/retrotransposon-derived protein RNase H-like domain-containing protein n=1 Tax=Mastacembelus armatus TaxID=205130 RepID=A0A3Q3LKU0_9TELE